jgi:hypothetical protein
LLSCLLPHAVLHHGPDAEMIFPNFLASGLDTADFVEQSAPVPWLLETTETDEYHFSHEGVRLVYDEARRWYSLYHATHTFAICCTDLCRRKVHSSDELSRVLRLLKC